MPDDNSQSRIDRGLRAVWRLATTEFVGRPPRVVRRVQTWGEFFVLTPMAAWVAAFQIAVWTGRGKAVPWALVLMGAMATTVALQLALYFKVRRIRRRAKNVDYRVCPECGYSLVDLDDEGTCPECGTAYTPAELWEVWTRK